MRIIILLLLVGTLQAQNYHTFNVPVSVGGATNASSLLTLNSTTQGFLIPRMTTAQRDAIPTPAVGLQIYNTETNAINIFNGTWGSVGGGIGGTIAAGQVAFGSASNTLSGNDNVRYDAVNNTLFVNTPTGSQGSYRLFVTGNSYLGTRAYSPIFEIPSYGTLLINNELRLYGSAILFGQSGNFWTTSGNFSIGSTNVSSSRLLTQGSSTANTSFSFLTRNSSATNTFSVGDAGLVTIYKDTESSGTQSSARLMVESGDANTNLVLSPKGTGAIIVGPAPDGTATGGAARGAGAVDLQLTKASSGHVAAGPNSGLFAGRWNFTYAAIDEGVVLGGRENGIYAGDYTAIVGGVSNSCYGENSIILGGRSSSTNPGASFSLASGYFAQTHLYGQVAHANSRFGIASDAQTSSLRLIRQVTGPFTRDLSLSVFDTITRPVLTATPTSRVWNARLQCVAVTNVQGTGGPAAGSVFSETMDITIKRIGSVTSIVNGTPMQSVSVSDIGMSGADFLVDADDTNESLRVRFQPPTIAAADTQIRAVCTVYLTEIGY